jgi:hypothetical protein
MAAMAKEMDDLDTLASILRLMKGRNEENLDTFQKQQLIKETNELLKNDIVADLVQSIRDTVDVLFGKKAAAPGAADVNLQVLRTKAEIIFFIFNKSQIVRKEAAALLDLIQHVSTLIVPTDHNRSMTQEAKQEYDDWKVPAYTLVVILQLAHVCALQQTSYLFSRDVDYLGMGPRDIDGLDVGNALENEAESREGMDTTFWSCCGAKGFACLVLAVFRQPEVDAERAPPADVEWFLFEACRMRAYSYIRLCMLPVLQVSYHQGGCGGSIGSLACLSRFV